METNGPEAKSGSMTNTARPSCAGPAGSSGGSTAARFIGIRKRRWPDCGNFWKTRVSIRTIEMEALPQSHRSHRDKKGGGDKEKGRQGDKMFSPFPLVPPLFLSLCLRGSVANSVESISIASI